MEKTNNRVENTRQFNHKRWQLQAIQTGRTEPEIAYESLRPEQKKLFGILLQYVTETGESLPFTCQDLRHEWQSWQTTPETLLPEMLYTDTVMQDECGEYRVTEFGRMVCKVGMLATPAQ